MSEHDERRRAGPVAACAAGGLLALAGLAARAQPRLSAALYLASIITSGWFIAPRALQSLRGLRADMHLLMTVAVTGALAIGEWFEAASVTFLFALSLLMERWSVGRAHRAIRRLLDLSPPTARYRPPGGGNIAEGPVEAVPVDATVHVRPGERIPLDGVVISGRTAVNEAPITGEAAPAEKAPGDTVFAGTINESAAFTFRATRPAADTTLARIIRLVEAAQGRRARVAQWVDTFARYYTPAVIGLAVLVALLPPLFAGAWGRWFYQALVILVIACPCALVISTPVTIVAGLASAARAGVLIKGGAFLEAPAGLDCIALDKTGTVTYGTPEVQYVVPFSGHGEDDVLRCAAALETESGHPIARAVVRAAERRGLSPPRAEGVRDLKGRGAEGRIRGALYWIGSHRLMHERGAETPDMHARALAVEDAAHTLVALGTEHHVCGLLAVADGVREGAADCLRALRALGVEQLVMLTGDNGATAAAVARAAGIDTFQAELLPEDKMQAVNALARRYRRVAMVGDGINDAPAMAAASVAVAMGAAGSDAAVETADIALMADDLSRLPWLIRHSRRTRRIIKQNIAFALGLKALFMALAVSGAATLWMAITADMGASLVVIFNGLRMLRDR
ncbi:MAG: heavy metal translocating P-type ATPase [Lentisphaerae bacterium]|nr:heavy metal translocating P-type ATPase [Lentisphaerota bacterium]